MTSSLKVLGEGACPGCGNPHAKIISRVVEFSDARASGSFDDEATQCDECGEILYTYEQGVARDVAYAAAVAEALRLPQPKRIKKIRLDLGFRQEDMELAMDVGPKTFSRWENGTVPPSRAAASLLWIAENQPDAFRALHKFRSSPPEADEDVLGTIVQTGQDSPAIAIKHSRVVATENFQVPEPIRRHR